MAAGRERFHWLDYVIFVVMLLVSCGIGVYYAIVDSKKQSKESFLFGNRQMKWLPVALSIVVSFNSGIVQLGVPAEIYLYGFQYWIAVFGTALSVMVVIVTFLPMLYKLQLTSSYEYLELRFDSKAVRGVGSFLMITSQVIYIGIATFSPAIALEAVTGFPVWASILCVGTVATFYTTVGGMKAVIWADVFQSVIMVAGMFAIMISGIIKVGGVQKMWEINLINDRIKFFNFDPDPTVRMSFWSLVIGKIFSWMPFYAVYQTSVQRYCCVSTLNKAKMTLILNVPAQFMMDTLACIIGLVVFSYFSECDPLNDPNPDARLSSPNQLVPLFVMKVIGWPGVPGLFLASIFSGSLSTVSSCLNALAAVTWDDLLKWKFDYLSERTKTIILKVLVFVYGVCGLFTAFLASLLQGSILQVSISFLSTASSPLMGLFILGAFFTRANWLGAIIGSCFGLALPMWISLGSYLAVLGTPPLNTSIAECVWNATTSANITSNIIAATTDQPVIEGINRLYTVSFMWFPAIGILTTVVIGMLASLILAPLIVATPPHKIKDFYLILPLDRSPFNRKNRPEKKDAMDVSELKEFAT